MKVVLHTTHCPKCTVLKSKLNSKNINYEENDSVDEMVSLNIMSVPVLQINDEFLQFADAIKWVNERDGV